MFLHRLPHNLEKRNAHMNKHYKIILDTETAGTLKAPLVYDLGYIVVNNHNEIVKQRDYIITQIYDNPELFATAYYAKKRPLYEKRLASNYCKKVAFGYALMRLAKDIEKYNAVCYAYNSTFDTNALINTARQYDKLQYIPQDFRILDIMKFIEPIISTKEYIEYCKAHNYLTKTGRVSTTAETLYRYTFEDSGFKEEHTALEDSRIEFDILSRIIREDL